MAKKYVSTSRADRTEDKRKRDANKAESKRNSRKRDLAIAAAGGAGALAAKTARNKVKLYNYNMKTAVNATMKERPNLNRKEVVRDYRKTSAQLAMKNKITTGKNAEPRPFREKGESFRVKDASRLPKSGSQMGKYLAKAMKNKYVGKEGRAAMAREIKNMTNPPSRYGRLTGGGGAPGLGRGQGGRGGGGGFLARGK